MVIHAEEQAAFLTGEVVVKLFQASDLAAVAAAHGVDPRPIDQFGTRAIYRLRIVDGSSPPEKVVELMNDARVHYAEPNYVGQTPEGRQRVSWSKGGDAGTYAEQWAPATIRLPEAQTVTRGAGVTVAVLDTGVDATHPVLAGKTMAGYDFVDMDTDPAEVGTAGLNAGFGHGTHVAGLVALVAPDATIMPLRVLDPDGLGNIWVLAEALKYAIDPDGNPATDDGADVINLSLSTTRRTNLLAELVAAVACTEEPSGGDGEAAGEDGEAGESEECEATGGQGALVAAAAGNSSAWTPEYPAGEGVAGSVAVGASTETDELVSFSNRGDWVTVLAPGEQIISSVPGGGYGVWSGTSMATPLVAGEAALIRAVNPAQTAMDVANTVILTAQRIEGPVAHRIDAAAAVGVPAR